MSDQDKICPFMKDVQGYQAKCCKEKCRAWGAIPSGNFSDKPIEGIYGCKLIERGK